MHINTAHWGAAPSTHAERDEPQEAPSAVQCRTDGGEETSHQGQAGGGGQGHCQVAAGHAGGTPR